MGLHEDWLESLTKKNFTSGRLTDTGVRTSHLEFEDRAKQGVNLVGDDDNSDSIGTGTHYAGTIAGRKYGVAKSSNIIGVKVIGLGNPNVTDVINGVKWALADHQENLKDMALLKGGVIMLNAGGLIEALNRELVNAIDAAIDAGMHVAISAGDNNKDACEYGAGTSKALVIGAQTLADERAYFSNYGRCVDLFAPGLNIQSSFSGADDDINVASSSGQAAAHVAGLIAYLISLQPEDETSPKNIREKVITLAIEDSLPNLPPETVNRIAYNGGKS
ncbi:serine protease [Puttea exsequens]|nr:serine protease [Puttea exsequens]